LETELLFEWHGKSKILLRSVHRALLAVTPWELTAVSGVPSRVFTFALVMVPAAGSQNITVSTACTAANKQVQH